MTRTLAVDSAARLPRTTDRERAGRLAQHDRGDVCGPEHRKVRGVGAGTCRLRAKAKGSGGAIPMRRTYVITVT